ncbi:hypothetical protein PVT67_13350 [Gallaecimonas kandeliae]|uniref:hypothetical protein n=1 Tax=Gallaecimonas kandeliae TaxID=3029055 RepID=UPI002647A57C|nr:hypothetical protein [Gallaecimonas kandeliae]WKE64648.1 hypothetical protein PVT67_13350 [Gallaecimonas kandeliae]
MYKRYVLEIDDFEYLIENFKGDELEYASKEVEQRGHVLELVNGKISASEISAKLLNNSCKPHFFLSHSSQDKELVTKFANYLYETFEIKSFIDSQLWGNIREATTEYLEKYCRGDGDYYFLDPALRAINNTDSILSSALLEAMDQSDCIIFVKSNNSAELNFEFNKIPESEVKYNQYTLSPWIAIEIRYANFLRVKRHEEIYSEISMESASFTSKSVKNSIEPPHFEHSLDLRDYRVIPLEAVEIASEAIKERSTYDPRLYTPVGFNVDILYATIDKFDTIKNIN